MRSSRQYIYGQEELGRVATQIEKLGRIQLGWLNRKNLYFVFVCEKYEIALPVAVPHGCVVRQPDSWRILCSGEWHWSRLSGRAGQCSYLICLHHIQNGRVTSRTVKLEYVVN